MARILIPWVILRGDAPIQTAQPPITARMHAVVGREGGGEAEEPRWLVALFLVDLGWLSWPASSSHVPFDEPQWSRHAARLWACGLNKTDHVHSLLSLAPEMHGNNTQALHLV